MGERAAREGTHRIKVTAEMEAPGIEAFYLEMRRLARRHGVDVQRFRAERMPGTERRHARKR